MATGKIKPNQVNDSKLYQAITTSKNDDRMPPAPAQKLPADQIALIAKWIQLGAKDLECDEGAGMCDTVNVTYAGFVAPLLAKYCVGCHSGGSPSGNIVLNSHSGVQTIAFNGRLLGAVTWQSGYQQMPKGSGKLSDCSINKIKSWINDGAQNN
jgi:mono/diheme cytochrome c family protein